MAKKDWQARLNDTYVTVGTLISAPAEQLARHTIGNCEDVEQEFLSGRLSLGNTVAKKGTTKYAERKTRRAVVLLTGVAFAIAGTKLSNKKAELDRARELAEKNKDDALVRQLQHAWNKVKEAKAAIDRFQQQQRDLQRQQAQNRYNQVRLTMNPLETEFKDDVLAFMGKWSVNPTPAQQGALDYSFINFTGTNMVKQMVLLPPSIKRGALDLAYPEFPGDTPMGDVYFLPWGSRHITRMKIPAYTMGSPDVFFTSALSGCSIFVVGPATSPTVYHAGVDGKVGDSEGPSGPLATHWTEYNAISFWRQCLLRNLNAELPPEGQGSMEQLMAAIAESNKADYTDDLSSPGNPPPEDDKNTTVRSRRFRELHQNVTANQPELETMMTWGCVFGIRSTGTREWSFYIQENAVITYIKHGTDDVHYRRCLPLSVKKFYPKPAPDTPVVYASKCFDARMPVNTCFTVDPAGLRITT